jgi:hypothetical protein
MPERRRRQPAAPEAASGQRSLAVRRSPDARARSRLSTRRWSSSSANWGRTVGRTSRVAFARHAGREPAKVDTAIFHPRRRTARPQPCSSIANLFGRLGRLAPDALAVHPLQLQRDLEVALQRLWRSGARLDSARGGHCPGRLVGHGDIYLRVRPDTGGFLPGKVRRKFARQTGSAPGPLRRRVDASDLSSGQRKKVLGIIGELVADNPVSPKQLRMVARTEPNVYQTDRDSTAKNKSRYSGAKPLKPQ